MTEGSYNSLPPTRGEGETALTERVALAIFKSTFHPRDAADERLVQQKRVEWPADWRRAILAAAAAIREMEARA